MSPTEVASHVTRLLERAMRLSTEEAEGAFFYLLGSLGAAAQGFSRTPLEPGAVVEILEGALSNAEEGRLTRGHRKTL